ncbi:MAG: TraB/GumN family protein [Flavobacteriales bacterium]|nr:TraB/GumN family protein [Flavobacteriales bacterium]
MLNVSTQVAGRTVLLACCIQFLVPGIRAQEGPGTVLYRVTNPDGAHTSHLFGTHHAFGSTFFDTLTIARDRLLAAQVLVLENLDGSTELINGRSEMTDWSRYLDREDLEYVQALFDNDPIQLEHLRPAELHAALHRHYAMYTCAARVVGDTSYTLDAAIGALARQHGLQLIGLESSAEQVELISRDVEGMPRKVHKRRLKAVLDLIRSENRSGCEEVERYARMGFDLKLEEPCTNTLMLTDRNARWMERIVPLLQEQDCFIAVGLSHLMYSCGLVASLREQGCSVEAVPLHGVDTR